MAIRDRARERKYQSRKVEEMNAISKVCRKTWSRSLGSLGTDRFVTTIFETAVIAITSETHRYFRSQKLPV